MAKPSATAPKRAPSFAKASEGRLAIPVKPKPLAKADPPRASARGILAKASEGGGLEGIGDKMLDDR